MEELGSSSCSDTDSGEYSKEVEEELYSVLHHNDFSQGIPSELLDKYAISAGSNNEFVISFKPTKESELNVAEDLKKEVVGIDKESESNVAEDLKKEVVGIDKESSSDSSSEDDIIVVEDYAPAVTPNSSKNKCLEQVVIEESSDSDGSSSVQIIDMSRKRKLSGGSGSSVINISSDGENLDFSINTTDGGVYDSDGNVSDVVEKTGFKWAAVASPNSWTKEMRKYYNSPCDKLRYFDHKKIRQGIKKGGQRRILTFSTDSAEDDHSWGSNDWFISNRDRYPEKRWSPRCDICRQFDHMARNCPKQDPTCHMCGVQGHTNQECPNSVCLQCGTRNGQYSTTCRHCLHMVQRPCFNCNQKGHESKFCPEKWREFHSTVEGPVTKPKQPRSGPFLCCNCGATNHAYEECNQKYLSSMTQTLSAYDWLYGKRVYTDWRYGGNGGPSPGKRRSPPYKRPKFSQNGPFRGNQSSDPDFSRDDFNDQPPSPLFQPPIPPWYMNRSQRPRKSKSLKRKDRRRKNEKNTSPGINFR